MATGVVSTARITHATPAATYAHVADRDWEADANMAASAQADGCRDIAKQLVEFNHGQGLTVAMGGGRTMFYPQSMHDIEDTAVLGRRTDGKDLVAQWRARYPDGAYVWNSQQFAALNLAKVPRLLGLFEADHMAFEADRAADIGGEPSLAEMTRTAITVLRHGRSGYFLMVEAGRIDHGHHAGNAYRALTDAVALADAVATAVDMTSERDTTIIVTADHSHTFNMVGYPARGNPILGLVRDDHGALMRDAMNLPYTTLNYGNGPGYTGASVAQAQGSKHFPHIPLNGQKQVEYHGITAGRPDLTSVNTADPNYLQESTVPMGAETHGGEDVVIFARGPGAQLVHGVLEQNVIYWIMREALGARLSAVGKHPAR